MNIAITGKGSPLNRLAMVFRNSTTAPVNGHQNPKNSPTSTASRNAQTTACLKPKAPGLNVVATATGHRITDGLTLPYKKQAERLAGQPLQATRKKAGLNDSLNTNLKPGLIKFWQANLQERPAPLWKIKAESQSLSPVCDTTTRNSAQRSKSKGLTHRIAKPLKTAWRASLKRDERGENFWHELGSAVAIAAFIFGMFWILGNTPAPGEYRTHDVLVTAETGE